MKEIKLIGEFSKSDIFQSEGFFNTRNIAVIVGIILIALFSYAIISSVKRNKESSKLNLYTDIAARVTALAILLLIPLSIFNKSIDSVYVYDYHGDYMFTQTNLQEADTFTRNTAIRESYKYKLNELKEKDKNFLVEKEIIAEKLAERFPEQKDFSSKAPWHNSEYLRIVLPIITVLAGLVIVFILEKL